VATTRRSTRAAKAPGLNRDYSDVDFREDEIYDGEQPTKGMYRLRLVAVADHTKQNEDEPSSVKWTFQIMEGEQNKHGDDVAGWRGYKYTNENAAWVEQKILVALGLIKPKGKISLTYAEMVKRAKPCRGLIALERYIPEDGDAEWRPGLTSVFMPDGVSAKAKSKAAEETDEDDDEDDEPPPTASRSRRRKQDPDPEPDEEDEDEDEPDEDEEEVDLDELAEELEALSLAELKKRAREEYGVKITRGMQPDAIVDAILDTLEGDEEDEEDEDEEDEPEPEPAKRPARSTTRGKTSSASSRGRSKSKAGYDDEPPF
jgi:hypothetical protein